MPALSLHIESTDSMIECDYQTLLHVPCTCLFHTVRAYSTLWITEWRWPQRRAWKSWLRKWSKSWHWTSRIYSSTWCWKLWKLWGNFYNYFTGCMMMHGVRYSSHRISCAAISHFQKKVPGAQNSIWVTRLLLLLENLWIFKLWCCCFNEVINFK